MSVTILESMTVFLIIVAGLVLSYRCGFIQIRRLGYVFKSVFGGLGKKAGKGEVTPLQAFSAALGTAVGTGNISGVAAAVTVGGAGAIFWMWVSALIGMGTKYAEVLLAVKYRERNKKGEWVGGPMYYIKNGLGKRWEILGILFCISGAIAAFGVGNIIQIGNMCDAANIAVMRMGAAVSPWAIRIFIGAFAAVFAGVTILGGVKQLGRSAETLVPLVSGIYILACVSVIVLNFERLPVVLSDIVKGAFCPSAILGGTVGITMRRSLNCGIKRGVFSNEAGLGSSSIAHSLTSSNDPVGQGMIGIAEVFADTIIICTLTGVTILISGIHLEYGTPLGSEVVINAMSGVFGGTAAAIIIALSIGFFALLTVLGWSLYGSRCCEYVFGEKSVRVYQVIFVLTSFVGPWINISKAWSICDALNGMMIVPNVIALLLLSKVCRDVTKAHFRNIRA